MSERDVDKKLDELLDEAIPIYEKGKNEEKIEEISFSKEHEAKMEKMFERIKRKEDFLDMAKVVTKVAAVLVVAFVLLGTFEPSNSAWKKRITEFFVKDEGTGYCQDSVCRKSGYCYPGQRQAQRRGEEDSGRRRRRLPEVG